MAEDDWRILGLPPPHGPEGFQGFSKARMTQPEIEQALKALAITVRALVHEHGLSDKYRSEEVMEAHRVVMDLSERVLVDE